VGFNHDDGRRFYNMAKGPDIQAERASVQATISDWVVNGDGKLEFMVAINEGTFLYYTVMPSRQVKVLEREAIVMTCCSKSRYLAEQFGLLQISMTKQQANDCMFMAESLIYTDGSPRLIPDTIEPVGFVNDPGWCFSRIAMPRMTPSKADIDAPRKWAHLGPFLHSVVVNMKDYDSQVDDSLMFRRLLSAIGALLWDSAPRREILYWYGEGGEGKTTFCNFLAHKLGPCALPNIKPKEMTDPYTKALFEGKRLIIAEEVGKGRFLTDELKALTGNRFITARAPYKAVRTFRNHSFIWMTSNQMPIINGESSETDRLRLVCSTARKDGVRRTEEDIFEELELYWPHIVDAGIIEYHASGKQVLPMTSSEIAECTDLYFLDADGWIEKHLEFRDGSFIPVKTLKSMLSRDKIGIKDIETRLPTLTPMRNANIPAVQRARRRVSLGGNPVHGWAQVGVKIESEHYRMSDWGGNSVPLNLEEEST
jgi:hypothetical protein